MQKKTRILKKSFNFIASKETCALLGSRGHITSKYETSVKTELLPHGTTMYIVLLKNCANF